MTFEQGCGSAIFYPTTDRDPLNMDPPKNAIKFKLSNKTSKTKKNVISENIFRNWHNMIYRKLSSCLQLNSCHRN